VRYGGSPEAGEIVAAHADEAGGKKITLQRGAEVLCGPAAHGSVDDQRRPIHAVGAAENTRTKSAEEKPSAVIALEFRRGATEERVDAKGEDDCAKSGFDDSLVAAGQQEKA